MAMVAVAGTMIVAGMAIATGVAIVTGAAIAIGTMIAAGTVVIGAAPIMAGAARAAGLNGAGITACASAAEPMTVFPGGCCGGRPCLRSRMRSIVQRIRFRGVSPSLIATLYNVLYK